MRALAFSGEKSFIVWNSPRIVFVTGLSGAGKSQAMKSFEDLGFYCLDTFLPPCSTPPSTSLRRSRAARRRASRSTCAATDALGDAGRAPSTGIATHPRDARALPRRRRRDAGAPLQRDAPPPSVLDATAPCAKRSRPTAHRSRRCASAPTSSSTRPSSPTARSRSASRPPSSPTAPVRLTRHRRRVRLQVRPAARSRSALRRALSCAIRTTSRNCAPLTGDDAAVARIHRRRSRRSSRSWNGSTTCSTFLLPRYRRRRQSRS